MKTGLLLLLLPLFKGLNKLISIALELGQRSQFDRGSTIQLAENLSEYYARHFPFDGRLNLQDEAAYWEHLPVSKEKYRAGHKLSSRSANNASCEFSLHRNAHLRLDYAGFFKSKNFVV